RYFAYALFSLAVQLKLYPLIFIVMLVKDWRDWKGNLKRFAGLALLNFALLFVMGPRIFLDFITNLPAQAANSKWYLITNHSISSFVYELTRGDWIELPARYKFLTHYDGYLRILFFGLFALCFGLALLQAYRHNEGGFNSHLLLACTIGALIIPVSVDYKLSILAAPMALMFIDTEMMAGSRAKRLLIIALILLSASAYAFILFPYKIKIPILSSAFLPLILILICASVLNMMRGKNTTHEV
ncbi:MAG: glycosyltransferase 87 family protein, partial [Anaerolineales bacterium]|nr:glycosyltransferase 87 family protein [Anaerolineales bacterium]